jgi:streptogramin lyase
LDSFTGAVADGQRSLLWLSDTEAGLTRVDLRTKRVTRQTLPVSVGDGLGLVQTANGALVALGQDPARGTGAVGLLTVSRGGDPTVRAVAGTPLGSGFLTNDSLTVADYKRGIVSVDLATAATRVVMRTPFIANLVAPGPTGTLWVVNDDRDRLVRLATTGKVLADVKGTGFMSDLAVDRQGRAWVAQGATVLTVDPDGRQETLKAVRGTSVLQCGTDLVISGNEAGTVYWYRGLTRATVDVGIAGAAVACDASGVWFVSSVGALHRVLHPSA